MTHFSYRLKPEFLEQYKDRKVDWGFADAGGTALGEIVFLSKYSRLKDDGTKERWHETCERVINGMFSIQKDHCEGLRLPWDEERAHRSAEEAYERMFTFKWLPPGRGLFSMGTDSVMRDKNSAALFNCGFTTTGDDLIGAMCWIMSASLAGIGCGYDLLGAGKYEIRDESDAEYVIPDSREGWVTSLRLHLEALLTDAPGASVFDYSNIRPQGSYVKGLGNVAPGPGPLKRMHEQISRIFAGRKGERITSRDVLDIGNIVGMCVVSGGIRRSALIALGDIDDESFVSAKDYSWDASGNPVGTAAERAEFGHLSNNSVVVESGMDLQSITDRILANGEPGVIWMDMIQGNGRLADAPDDKDRHSIGVNPCLSGDTMLLDERGWIRFDAAASEDVDHRNILVDARITYEPSSDGIEHPDNWKMDKSKGKEVARMRASNVFMTKPSAELVKVTLANGMSARMTPDHLVSTTDGMIEAGALIPGEHSVLITKGPLPEGSLGEPVTLSEKAAVLMGIMAGDGYMAEGKMTDKAIYYLYGEKAEIADKIVSWITDLQDAYGDTYKSQGGRPFTYPAPWYRESHDRVEIQSSFLAAFFEGEYGLARNTKTVVPARIMRDAISREARFYVAGLAYCDGTVNKVNKVGSSSIRISSIDRKLLADVQLICLANGILGNVYHRRSAGAKMMPDGAGGMKEYQCKDSYEIVFMAGAFPFMEHIGFLGYAKDAKAREYVRPSRKFNAWSNVVSVEPDGVEPVYCLKEDVRRILTANGITARRCGEAVLASRELCNLSDVSMMRHDSVEDFMRTLKFAFLYCKTVTLMPTAWGETNAVIMRNRRIGVSLSGVTNFLDRNGASDLRHWMDSGYGELKKYDDVYSEWLCVRNSIRLSVIKPGGSTSILMGESPGVHWGPGGDYFIRNMRFQNTDALPVLLEAAGYKVEPAPEDPEYTVVVGFPIHSLAKRSESEVPIYEKAHVAAIAQRHWADQAVSVTLSFNKDSESTAIPQILSMFDGQLKTASFLPMGNETYRKMPFERSSQEAYEEAAYNLLPADLSPIYDGLGADAIGEMYCTSSACEMRMEETAITDAVARPDE